ncbi:leucine-rich repeat and IQ domain-containing protein 1-like [Ylistrum balloti]|uniref:leucine-rich repeat and IQ domain-containing protein 1-like n=1 Tax=Ylistrum balloti TaxID=509963 RepID=UPI002905E5A8|nr:leucine-rich repeat and IQ domain-containing protein 1-like [Ylistrum balloti]
MPPSGVSGMMDDEALIEAEIQQQLQQLDNEDDNDPGLWDEVADNPGLQDDREASPHEEVIGIPAEMDVYIRLLNNQTKAFEEELEECDDLINYKHGQNSKSIMAVEDFELLKEAAYEQGQDPEELRRKILDEVSRATENMTGADLETEPIVLAGVGDGPGDQGPGIGDEKALVLVDERQLAFQREMKEQMDNAEKQYRIREEKLKAALEEERRKSEILNRETEEQRQQKRQQLEREVTTLAKERLVEQERLEEEEQQTYKQQEAALQQHEVQVVISCVRKENKAFKEILEEKVEIRKKKMEDEKIKVAEQVIQQRREIMEQEEETKRLEMEAKEKEKEEKRRKKEEEERQKEEKKRQKEEEKRIKEEQKRLEKERELEEKRRKKEEEERKKQEEKLRKEEEKKRREAEEVRKKEEEKKRREAEEERKKEEARKLEEQKRHDEEKEKERKRQEALQIEEERKKAEAEKFEIERKQKEDEERKLQEAREQKEEEERRQQKGEEQKIKEQTFGKEKREIDEILKESIELTTPRSSRRDGRISSRSSKHDQLSQSTDQEKERKRDQKAMMLGLPDRAEVRRLQWIKSCIPWSKVSNEPWKLKTSTTKKPSRRPSSAKKLEPIDKYIITSAAQVDTLRQVTTVQLQDLPGCDLSTLGQCWGLKYLSMTNCNLVAVDGLHSCKQLQLVHFKHNYIEYVDLKDLGNLTYVNISHNKLSVIHGLEGCGNLRWLDLSYNRLTRIGGMYSLRRLHTVNLSHNQLISTAGLGDTPTIQNLDLSHNHLQDCQDTSRLCLLQVLKLSSNNLLQLPDLKNQVLLQTLCVEDNSLANIKGLGLCWFPLLQKLDLSQNSIEHLVNCEVFHLLRDVDVGSNQIIDHEVLTKCLCDCVYVEKLGVIGDDQIHIVQKGLVTRNTHAKYGTPTSYSAKVMDKFGNATFGYATFGYVRFGNATFGYATFGNATFGYATFGYALFGYAMFGYATFGYATFGYATFGNATFGYATSKLAEMFPRLLSLDSAEYVGSHDNVSPIRPRNSFEAMCVIQAKVFQDATNKLDQDLMSLESDGSVDLAYMCEIHFKFCDKMYQVAVEYRNSHEYGEVTMTMPTAPSTPKTVSHPRSGRARPVPAIREDQYISPKEMFERALQGGNSSVNNSQGGGMSTGREPKITADMVGKFLERDRDSETYRLQREKSAILIQAAWRGYCVRKRLLAEGLQVKQQMSDIDYEVLQELHRAATKIQAVFRGYNLRNKLEKAIEFARLDDSEEEDFGEVDLGDFNFDENMLDDWKPPETPQIPASHAVLGKPPSGKLPPSDHIPYLDLGDKPHPPGQPRKAWRGMDSPLSDLQTSQRHPRPPSSLASGTITGMDSHRSVLSKKEEKITQEWGFKDNQTAILMMQRAKKMKYNAERRKKLGKLDPKQRLALFRKLEETTNIRTVVQPSRKTLPRKEYFQARQQEIERKDLDKRVENHNRTKRTFEWIHTQVGDYEVSDSRINPTQPHNESLRKIYGSEGNLPKMTAEVTSGRPVRLMSPGLDIQSVDSVSNHGDPVRNPRRFSAGSDASSTRLPPIKTGSAPSVRGKEKMSWRRKEVNKSIGWGGGKKRSHVN